jgi:hypothetical protein
MSIVVTPIITATRLEWMATTAIVVKDRVLYETDTGNYKVGDGTSTYAALPYATNISTFTNYVFMVPLDNIGEVFTTGGSGAGSGSSTSLDITGTDGQVLIVQTNSAGVSSILSAPSNTSFQGSLEVIGTYSNTFTTDVISFVGIEAVSDDYTDVGILLVPKGKGGITAGIPNMEFNSSIGGAAYTGGYPRGNNAVDLQTTRSAPTQVASGDYSGLLSGINNTNSGKGGVVAGGQSNTNDSDYGVIVGGGGSTLSSGDSGSFIGGGYGHYATGFVNGIVSGNAHYINGRYCGIGGGDQNRIAATNMEY